MDDEASRILADFARSREPSAARMADAWESINERIALGDPGPLTEGGSAPAAGLSTTAKLGLAVVAGAVVVLAIVGTRPAEHAPSTAAPLLQPIAMKTLEPPEPRAPDPLPAAPAPEPAAPLVLAPQEPESKPKAKRRSRRSKPTSAPAAPAEPATTSLAEEMKLLRRASRQLRADLPRQALTTLDEHRRRFPNGTLAAEREVERAEAHCRKGDAATARRIVDAFLRAHPDTALRQRASSICKGSQP